MRIVRTVAALAVVAVVAVGGVLVLRWLLDQRRVVDETAADIEQRLRDLDPVTRAAVVGKLGSDLRRKKS